MSAFSALALSASRVTVEVTPGPALHPAVIAELKRVGNNVNQIAAALNAREFVPARDIVLKMRELLHALIRDEVLAARIKAVEPGARSPDGTAHS